jgi:SAM-dependent methyltransferase
VSAATASERLVMAVDALDPRPADRVLEIGCGQGVAVSLVCERLVDGHMTAIDRSPTMIRAAERRNRSHVAAGRLRLETVALADADFGDQRFDRVLAVRVAALGRPPGDDLAVLRRSVAPGAVVGVFGDHPTPERTAAGQRGLIDNLQRHGFDIAEVVTRPGATTTLVGVLATPVDAAPVSAR